MKNKAKCEYIGGVAGLPLMMPTKEGLKKKKVKSCRNSKK